MSNDSHFWYFSTLFKNRVEDIFVSASRAQAETGIVVEPEFLKAVRHYGTYTEDTFTVCDWYSIWKSRNLNRPSRYMIEYTLSNPRVMFQYQYYDGKTYTGDIVAPMDCWLPLVKKCRMDEPICLQAPNVEVQGKIVDGAEDVDRKRGWIEVEVPFPIPPGFIVLTLNQRNTVRDLQLDRSQPGFPDFEQTTLKRGVKYSGIDRDTFSVSRVRMDVSYCLPWMNREEFIPAL